MFGRNWQFIIWNWDIQHNINPFEQIMNNSALKEFNDIIKTLSTEFKYKKVIATA